MPKMKTHSGAKKRFRVTGSGKIMHRKAGKMHLNEHKSEHAGPAGSTATRCWPRATPPRPAGCSASDA